MSKSGNRANDGRIRNTGSASDNCGIKTPQKNLKDAPFDVDASDDGDMATPKRELSDDELKEQEDRRP